MRKNIFRAMAVLVAVAGVVLPGAVYAATDPDLTQTINAGTLATNILDASRNPVASPSAAMAAKNFSFDCQTSTGTLGSSSQRLYVINGKNDGAGWSLSLAATGGASDSWANTGDTESYAFNDATGAGCTNGQLTVDPSVGTVTDDCASTDCTSATVTKGSSTAMTGATPVTLLTGGVNADIYRGYLTGAGLSQEIPAEQAPDSYSLNMTLTVTAD